MKFKFILTSLLLIGFSIMSNASEKWISPTKKDCISNGGKINSNNLCEANWKDAKSICKDSGGDLPTIEKLKEVAINCGVDFGKDTPDIWKKNKQNSSYQSCYKDQGFDSKYYWSSTSYPIDDFAWYIDFYYGYTRIYKNTRNNYVQCIKN